MNKNLEIGYNGELIAAKYLREKKYEIIERNYRNKYGEIDLIAWDKKALVFVEVRTKVGQQFGSPEDSINWKKINKLKRNAAAYTALKKHAGVYRIDAVCIVLGENSSIERVTHYQNITFWRVG
ncbi:MAG: YraN family protein [Candidatus Omnitrophota bacterium]|nr:YraN family protein [Candidatus Omnitrophota bacterium]